MRKHKECMALFTSNLPAALRWPMSETLLIIEHIFGLTYILQGYETSFPLENCIPLSVAAAEVTVVVTRLCKILVEATVEVVALRDVE